jgi:hypothetical protein
MDPNPKAAAGERRDTKLKKHCDALADVIVSIRPVFAKVEPSQKALIETMIGAAIWYIPKPSNAWTGSISIVALKIFHPNSGVTKPKFSEERVYPRKVAARLLLEDEQLDGARMAQLFREKYGRLHYITPDEKKSVQKFQRANVFTTPEEAYSKAGIIFVQVAKEDLRLIKQRNQATIEKYLKTDFVS